MPADYKIHQQKHHEAYQDVENQEIIHYLIVVIHEFLKRRSKDDQKIYGPLMQTIVESYTYHTDKYNPETKRLEMKINCDINHNNIRDWVEKMRCPVPFKEWYEDQYMDTITDMKHKIFSNLDDWIIRDISQKLSNSNQTFNKEDLGRFVAELSEFLHENDFLGTEIEYNIPEIHANILVGTQEDCQRVHTQGRELEAAILGEYGWNLQIEPRHGDTALNWLAMTQGTDLVDFADRRPQNFFEESLLEEMMADEDDSRVVFSMTMDLDEIYAVIREKKTLYISKSTPCGLYNNIQCTGGVLYIHLEKCLALPASLVYHIEIEVPNSKNTLGWLYRLRDSFWKNKPMKPEIAEDLGVQIIMPKPFTEEECRILTDRLRYDGDD